MPTGMVAAGGGAGCILLPERCSVYRKAALLVAMTMRLKHTSDMLEGPYSFLRTEVSATFVGVTIELGTGSRTSMTSSPLPVRDQNDSTR
jgi:hypothetical protein